MSSTVPYDLLTSNNAASLIVVNDALMVATDLRLAIFSISTQTITTPTGWELVAPTPIVFQTSRRIYVFSRTHPGASESSHTFTFSAAGNYSCTSLGVRGYRVIDPVDVDPTVGEAGSGTAIDAPSVTTLSDDALLITTHHVLLNSSAVTLSTPSGMTLLGTQAGTGTAGHAVGAFSEVRTTKGATGIRTSTSNQSGVWGAMSIVLAPRVIIPEQQSYVPRQRAVNF